MAKSQIIGFAFSANVAAGGVGNFSVAQMLCAIDYEVHILAFLSSGAAGKLVHSPTPVIESGEAPLVGVSTFAPSGKSLQATLTKGYTTVAPPADAFEVGFDVDPPRSPIVVREGEYLAWVKKTADSSFIVGWVAEERRTRRTLFG